MDISMVYPPPMLSDDLELVALIDIAIVPLQPLIVSLILQRHIMELQETIHPDYPLRLWTGLYQIPKTTILSLNLMHFCSQCKDEPLVSYSARVEAVIVQGSRLTDITCRSAIS